MMTPEEFKKLYFQKTQNSKTSSIVGVFIGIAGGAFFLYMGYSIYGVIGFGFLAVSGMYAFYVNTKHEASTKAENNPLIKGIEEGYSNYIKWFYVTILKHKKTVDASSFNTYYFSAYDEKQLIVDLSLEDEKQCDEIVELFSTKFPNAVNGYSDEIHQKMVAKYHFKVDIKTPKPSNDV